MTSAQKNKIRVGRSSAGLGIFALKELRKNELVGEYTGEKISAAEGDRRGGKYLFTIDKQTVIDGKSRRNTARYFNHSCKPNCYVEINERTKRIFIHAKRRVLPGEELTYNYGKEYFNEYIKPFGCKCTAHASKN
ncbi:MAG: hypothetical protein COU11_02115 [Candidatus Harrisonbacteria bacterium CG10_big_fil_rev_8_21_14_0_10_49_15]|uniref:SET domain-containing protein n=1 Tax=Candidatus Harrisonbacteria bacterium CG10_big_fil_rev_8_21_14_0_10_49_15 TaxID=1974587 RepID=A0A2H0UKR7_9BACT|nr:MAG: hypothetical protein COU11_02115 [Candidatus Harrisonbacteria bacterium CG10_big_fil_rev_8_21_14_0_10_49_15]